MNAKLDDIDTQIIDFSVLADCGVHNHLYHGTSKEIASTILKIDKIHSGKELSYLGRGVYCYYLDRHAAKDWAKNKHKEREIAILDLTADLGNMLLICEELYRILSKRADALCGQKRHRKQQYMGLLIERLAKDYTKSKYGMDIRTIARVYVVGKCRKDRTKRRPALMYCLIHPDDMIKGIKLYNMGVA